MKFIFEYIYIYKGVYNNDIQYWCSDILLDYLIQIEQAQMCSYPPKKIHSQMTVRLIELQSDWTAVTLTEPQSDWQNCSYTDRTTVRLTELQSHWQNHSHNDRTTDISKPYIPFTHMLQAHCLQSFSKQPIRIKDSSAVLNAIILLVDRQCNVIIIQHTVIHPFEIAHTQTRQKDRLTSRVLSGLSAGNNR